MKFKLRPVTETDHAWLIELHNDPLVLRNNSDPRPITLDGHLAWWNSVVLDKTQERKIFTVDAERVGFSKIIDVDLANKACWLGADIHRDFRGNGYAKHLWELMLHRCFAQLNLHRVALTTAEFNDVGIHTYKKLGFKEDGRLVQALLRDGKYYDEITMYMLDVDYWNGS